MRFFIFLFGLLAGWFLKEVNWKEWRKKAEDIGINFSPSKPVSSTLPIPQKMKTETTNESSEEIFPDQLEKIKGIGPVIRRKLNDSGIFTFAQLGTLTPQELEEIVGASIKRFTDEEEIINQAQKLAA